MICNCQINQECLKVNSKVLRDFKMLYLSSCPPWRAASFFGHKKARQRAVNRDLTDRRKWNTKHWPFGERIGFVSRLLLRALGISIAEYSSLKTIRVLHTISGLLHPLSLLREPRHSPCFPRQKLFSYNKLGLYFMVGCAKPNQRSVLSPFLAVCCPKASILLLL